MLIGLYAPACMYSALKPASGASTYSAESWGGGGREKSWEWWRKCWEWGRKCCCKMVQDGEDQSFYTWCSFDADQIYTFFSHSRNYPRKNQDVVDIQCRGSNQHKFTSHLAVRKQWRISGIENVLYRLHARSWAGIAALCCLCEPLSISIMQMKMSASAS